MSARSLAVWVFFLGAATYAQDRPAQSGKGMRVPLSLEHARLVQIAQPRIHASAASGDTIRVLALMVDFQTSGSVFTTGNGRFQLDAASSQNLIDPPPHDSAYFAYKLVFLSNYFRKVSNGKVNIQGDVLGRVVTLSKTMESYSPPKDGSNEKPLADLVVESWLRADSLYPSFPFNKYDAFVIFHAGVGRDINLVAALGYDPAPFDIPSISFNLRTLRNFLSDQSYAGVPVSRGTFRIANTLILPETETRPIQYTNAVDTLQGSINGLLANSFGSYLGLPDLFDTKTGSPSIGQFGLMDVAGSISFYAGLFPPEPSAWEKVYLGWVTPITLAPGTSTVSLPAVGLKTGTDTIYKIPITDREYFLIENRSRDPLGNGQRITLRQGNSIVTRYFPNDTTGFRLDDVKQITGSVIDVEDFDWALPGLTTSGEQYVGGGILIWHVDEDVIAQGLKDNTVNADPAHRGVYVEEADGSQDIGRSYDPFSSPGAGTELGWPLDFWFDGNPAPPYKNIFDDESKPDSRSSAGSASLVTVRGFTPRAPRMSATIDVGTGQFQRLQGFAKSMSATSSVTAPSALTTGVFFGVDRKVYGFKSDGSSLVKDPSGLLSPVGGSFTPAVIEYGSGQLVVGGQDSTLYIFTLVDNNADGTIDAVQTAAVPLGDRITTPPMAADLSIAPSFVVGTAHGFVCTISYAGVLTNKTRVSSGAVNALTQLLTPSLSKPPQYYITTSGRLVSELTSVALGDSVLPWTVAAAVSRSGNFVVAGEVGGRKLVAFNQDLSQKVFDVTLSGGTIADLAVADIDGDGEKDVIVMAGDRITVVNRNGAPLPGYPVAAPVGETFTGNPLIGDFNGDGTLEIVASVSSGIITAFDKEGHRVAGFPVQFAASGETSVALFRSAGGKFGIVGASSNGSIQAMEMGKTYQDQSVVWSQMLKDSRHSNFDQSVAGPGSVSANFLPADRTYNWPNPVYGSSTQIRYYTPEDAAIAIRIFDLSGMKIAELNARSRAGLDGEVTWDVSKIQSGVYLARIEATGSSRSQVAIIKIAVVK